MNAQTVVQILFLLDQVMTLVSKQIEYIRGTSEADEKELRELLEKHRASNDEAFKRVIATLRAKS